MPRVKGLSGIIEVCKWKEVTFGPYIPGYSDEDSIASGEEVGEIAKVEEQLITFEQDELKEKVAASVPEVAMSSVSERWTTFEEEKLATEHMLSKFGAQAVLNRLGGEVSARTKLLKKLALQEQEVKLSQQIIKQKKLLVLGKQALSLASKKVKYNVCHKFKRGGVVAAFKSTVDKEISAAKQRLGLMCNYKQFNMEEVLTTINRLAPDGKYLSSKPATAAAATSRPRRSLVKKEKPSVRYFTAPVPSMPIQQHGERAAPTQSEETSCPQQQASAGYGGDYGIVSDGGVVYQEPFYDHVTQLYQEDPCVQSTAGTIDYGYFDDITEQQEFLTSDDNVEEEVISDVSVEASLCWDSDGNIYY